MYKNWWAVVLPKLGVSIVLKLRDGRQYLIRAGTTDLAVVNEVNLADHYTVVGLGDLAPDAVIIDVGANIGDFAVKMAHAYPGGKVIAVEPVEDNCRMIDIQSALNSLRNITVVRTALGGVEGEVDIHLAGVASSTQWGQGISERVPQTTLGKLFERLEIEQVALLKMDCEGAEWEILPAADDVMSKVQRVVMEYHRVGDWTPERLAEWLRARGFKVQYDSGGWNGMLWAVRPSPASQGPAMHSPSNGTAG